MGESTRSDSRRSRLARSAAERRTRTGTGSRERGTSSRATSRPAPGPASVSTAAAEGIPFRPAFSRSRLTITRSRSASIESWTSTTPRVFSNRPRTVRATSCRISGVGPVDLRHHGVEDRRTRRDLDDLHPRPPRLGDLHEGRPDALGDVVALGVAVVLGREVDLQVRHVGRLAQEVVPHEAVEVEGGGGARVDLDVLHLGNGGEVAVHLPGGLQGHLEGRSLVVVDHHLELALVVEGQHLDLDQAEADAGRRSPQEDEHQRERTPSA